ncbi:hypothetical protein QPK31_06260 [Massilia sp. YIM B02769]|uniref:hypothetical protein n=1 Tax=Massilia sp. YIM B02769 TaxID=3050129 RepID=UPI0025B6992B|nr:hypothetical protein [Massilia sp. YIM B02769]MDN4057831.1 hypothetical protein [Massilia sp. YIM B02769]
MNAVKKIHDVEKVREDFEKLIENLSKVLKEERPRTNILSTKLWQIKKELSNFDNLDRHALAKLVEIVVKYNTINNLFSSNIDYNKKDLIKIIEGTSNYIEDTNDTYNDHFFELSMGIRFSLAFQNQNAKINLASICDIIIDDKIAVECKYIHSLSNIMKNIKKAREQIDTRISNNQAQIGFIALDLSNVCARDRISEFADYTFKKFIENYEILESKGHLKGDLADRILRDRNFTAIVANYATLELETALHSELGFSYKMPFHTKAIIFQSLNSFAFEYKGKIKPMTTRGTTYFINENLLQDEALMTKKFIHSLAVGV